MFLFAAEKSADGRWLIEESSARMGRRGVALGVLVQAAAIVGCTETTIDQAAQRGVFVRRRVNRGTPSLERTSVEEVGRRRRAGADRIRAGPPRART